MVRVSSTFHPHVLSAVPWGGPHGRCPPRPRRRAQRGRELRSHSPPRAQPLLRSSADGVALAPGGGGEYRRGARGGGRPGGAGGEGRLGNQLRMLYVLHGRDAGTPRDTRHRARSLRGRLRLDCNRPLGAACPTWPTPPRHTSTLQHPPFQRHPSAPRHFAIHLPTRRHTSHRPAPHQPSPSRPSALPPSALPPPTHTPSTHRSDSRLSHADAERVGRRL
mmetsp:Transcript_33269/g.107614  ORF Transcript_33269/g.107614 Transcript_33269/m.107614 type:complete len:220 (+) Transcript_33269:2132-2791(+)